MDDTRSEYQRRIGVGERSFTFVRDKNRTRKRRIIAEEGPRRGKIAGIETDHSDGRVDAHVVATPTWVSPLLQTAALQDPGGTR